MLETHAEKSEPSGLLIARCSAPGTGKTVRPLLKFQFTIAIANVVI